MGGWKKRGVENLTDDTLPKEGFWTPPLVRYVFHPPQVSVLCFSCTKNPRQSRPEALLEGCKTYRESAFSGTFSTPPYVLHPHITAQMFLSHQIFQISNRISPKEFTTHFCRHGHSNLPCRYRECIFLMSILLAALRLASGASIACLVCFLQRAPPKQCYGVVGAFKRFLKACMLHLSEGIKNTAKVFSALKTQVPQQAKERFGVYRKAYFQGKRGEIMYTPKSLPGVCVWVCVCVCVCVVCGGGPLRTVLVYRLGLLIFLNW